METPEALDEYFRTTYTLHILNYIKKVWDKNIDAYEVSDFIYRLCIAKTISMDVKKDVIDKIFLHIKGNNNTHNFRFTYKEAFQEFYIKLAEHPIVCRVNLTDIYAENLDSDIFKHPKIAISFDKSSLKDLILNDYSIVNTDAFKRLYLSDDLKKMVLMTLLRKNQMALLESLQKLWYCDLSCNVRELNDIEFNKHIIKYFFEKKLIRMTYVSQAINLSQENYIIFYQYVKFHDIDFHNIVGQFRTSAYSRMNKNITLV